MALNDKRTKEVYNYTLNLTGFKQLHSCIMHKVKFFSVHAIYGIYLHQMSLRKLPGNSIMQGSISCLASRGYMVSFGQSSGKPDPVPLSDLAPKSLFLTRPSFMHYTATRDELLEAAGELFANVSSGVLRVRINHTYPLSEAARVHADLEARKTSGSIVLIPDS